MPVLQTIMDRVGSLTRIQRSIAEYVLKHPDQTFKMSITELARKTGAKSESTVVRFLPRPWLRELS